MSMVLWFHRFHGVKGFLFFIVFVVSRVSWFHRFRGVKGFMVSKVSWCQASSRNRLKCKLRHCLHSVANKKARISDALRG